MDFQLDQNHIKTSSLPLSRTGTNTRLTRAAPRTGTRRLAMPPSHPVLTLSEVAQVTGLPTKIVASIVMCLRQTGAPYVVRNLLSRTQMPDPLTLMTKVFAKQRNGDDDRRESGIAKSGFEVLETDEHGMVQLKAFFWHELRRDLFLNTHRRGLIRIRVDFWQGGRLWRTTYEFIIAKDIKVRVKKVRSRADGEFSWRDSKQNWPR